MKKFAYCLGLAALFLSFSTAAVVIQTEESPGVYQNAKSTSGVQQVIVNSGSLNTTNTPVGTDPCMSSAVVKSSAIINISTAATTALVAPNGAQTVYVCGFMLTISQVITTANTLKFVQGTGASCATGQTDLTGIFGAGGITAAAPIVVASGTVTVFKTAASGGLCAVTVIGATASFQGVLTYVQQ